MTTILSIIGGVTVMSYVYKKGKEVGKKEAEYKEKYKNSSIAKLFRKEWKED